MWFPSGLVEPGKQQAQADMGKAVKSEERLLAFLQTCSVYDRDIKEKQKPYGL